MTLYYEKTGSGRPLVLVHGNGEDHTIFDEAVKVLSRRFTCYAVDSRGHGKNPPVSEYHYEEMADDIIDLMNELGLSDVCYCGFSDGGILGCLIAAKTDLIGRMVICGTNTRPDRIRKGFVKLMKFLYTFRRDPLIRLMLEEPDLSDELLAGIRAKTLVLAGSHDLVMEEDTLHIAEMIPDSECRIIAGEGHGSYIVHSTKIAGWIIGFCSK